jgi:PAP2 superfamily
MLGKSALSLGNGDNEMLLFPMERLCIAIMLATTAMCAALAAWKGITIIGATLLSGCVIAALFFFTGLFFRTVRKDDVLSLLFLNIGLFSLFTFVAVLYNHLLLPLSTPVIDPLLIRIDAWFGFDWPALMQWVAQHVWFSELLRYAYESSLYIVLLTFLMVSVHNNRFRVHTFVLALQISSLMTITVWSIFPGAGASAHWTLDPAIEAAVNPIVGTAYGQQLLELYKTGSVEIDVFNLKGLIGFPSYHTVMALIVIYGLWGYWKCLALASPVIILTVPAIFIHGGHNLTDFIAGAAITTASVYAAHYWQVRISRPSLSTENLAAHSRAQSG